ncbi:carboxypeptidase Y-deficient [Elasticomyces elasticus]|nr:carboxypeptidase Y-deficient [Elasticomyces elasticus]
MAEGIHLRNRGRYGNVPSQDEDRVSLDAYASSAAANSFTDSQPSIDSLPNACVLLKADSAELPIPSGPDMASTPLHARSSKFLGIQVFEKLGAEHRNSAIRRVGRSALWTLLVTMLLILTAVGFLLFLWYSDFNNRTWHLIMVRGWATRAVSISSLVLRTAVDFQACIAVAMLASLLLESGVVLLRDAPMISTTRAHKATPSTLLQSLLAGVLVPGGGGLASILTLTALVFLCATFYLIQFSSTLLLWDLRLGQLPGLPQQSLVAVDFAYTRIPFDGFHSVWYSMVPRIATWYRNPPAFPAFAEYSEPATSMDGVDDTGVLLRAFLPYPDAESRQSLRNYSGKALVLDSRVMCQPPVLTDLSASFLYADGGFASSANLVGSYLPSRTTSYLWTPDDAVSSNCSFLVADATPFICQLGGSYGLRNVGGGLISQFIEPHDRNRTLTGVWGTPFFVLNTTGLNATIDRNVDYSFAKHNGSSDFKERGPWLDILFRRTTQNYSSVLNTSYPLREKMDPSPGTLSLTLCYTAWDTARLQVNIHSDLNRSEPVGRWAKQTGFYTVPNVQTQYEASGSDAQTRSRRGILSLANPDPLWNASLPWLPAPSDITPGGDDVEYIRPFVQAFGDVSSTNYMYYTPVFAYPDFTAMLPDPHTLYSNTLPSLSQADPTIAMLYRNFSASSGSVAQTMSSMITLLSGMAYYDQMPYYETTSNATQTFFANALYPQSHHGLWIVLIAMAVHLVLIGTVATVFALWTHYSFLGNHWQAVAQLDSSESRVLLAKSSMATDTEVRGQLKAAGSDGSRVGIGMQAAGEHVNKIALNQPEHGSAEKLGRRPSVGQRESLAPPAPPSKQPVNNIGLLSPSESSVSLNSQASSAPLSVQNEDLASQVALDGHGSAQAAAAASSRMVCPICNEEMVTLLQLNRHIDDLHGNLEEVEQDEAKTWFKQQMVKTKKFQPLQMLNQKLRGLDIFESNNEIPPPPTATPPQGSRGASPAPLPPPPRVAETPLEPDDVVVKSHWQQASGHDGCADPMCGKRLGANNGQVNCRHCGKLFCDEHTMYQMKLSRSAQHEPVRGLWYRVCETCYKTRDGYNHHNGAERNHFDFFQAKRRKTVDKQYLETSRLETRLTRLTQLLADPPPPESGQGSLWSSLVGDNKSRLRALEQTVVPWQEDVEVNECPFCRQPFSQYSFRRHHCRTCGRVVCGDPATACSTELGLDVDTSRSTTQPFSSSSSQPTDVDVMAATNLVSEKSPGKVVSVNVRLCKDCHRTIFSKPDFARELTAQTPDQRAYQTLRQFEHGIRVLLPRFQRLLVTLQDPDNPPPSAKLAEASKVRKRLTDSFTQYDFAARRMRDLPTESQTQQKLQMAVYQQSMGFLHIHMLPLKSLPKIMRHAAPRAIDTVKATKPPTALAAIKYNEIANGSERPGSSRASSASSTAQITALEAEEKELRERLMVLEEQKFFVKEMIGDANRRRKFDEVAALAQNVEDLTREVDQIQGQLAGMDFAGAYSGVGDVIK